MHTVVLPGTFAPISDSWMLAERVAHELRSFDAPRALDLCTGSGVVAISAASVGADVTAVDVSRRALTSTWINAKRQRQHVKLRRGHLFGPVADERFDCITVNPPYVPAPTDTVPTSGPSRAWVGGTDGRLVLDQVCMDAHRHLNPNGIALLVHSSLIGVDRTLALLRSSGMVDAEVIERVRGPLGPLMVEARANGLLPDDTDEEDVVVIRARAGDGGEAPRPFAAVPPGGRA